MNPRETQQVISCDKKWGPSTKRVKISPTNVRLETIVHQKEETFQVINDVIKNSTCFKAFNISAEVLEIFMQQFWYTIKKIQGTYSYEFVLANKRCVVDAEVFKKILDICPRVEGEEFTEVQDNDATFTFLIDLGYKSPLHKHTNMYVDHMYQSWRTLAAIINKCLFGKTRSNDRLRKSRIDILIGEDYQEYGLPILNMMLNNKIKQSDSYQIFLKYSTGLIPPKKSRGKGSQGKKTIDVSQESVDVSDESKPKPAMKKTSSRSTRGVVIQDTLSAPKPKPTASKLKLKGIRTLTLAEQEAADTMEALKEIVSATSSEGTSTKLGVSDEEKVTLEANVILEWGSENESEHSEDSQLNSDEEEKKDNDGDVDDEDEDDDHISDIQSTDDEDAKTKSNEDEIYKYKIQVHKDVDVDIVEAKTGDAELAGNAMISDYQVKESTELPLPSSSLSISFGFGTHFLNLSSYVSLTGVLKDSTEAEISSLMDVHIQQETLQIYTHRCQLRVAKLEKDVSELNKIDHSVKTLASLKSQVPTVVEHYLGSKIGDDLQKGKKTKRRRTKESESSMKPSTTKETSKGKALTKSSKTGKSATAQELIEEPIDNVVMDDLEITANEDVVNDADCPQDYVAPKTNKDTWFKQPPRPPTPDPEWNKRQVVIDQPEPPWFNKMVSAIKDPLTFDELMDTPINFYKYAMNRLQIANLTQEILVGPVYNLLKGTCTSSIELEYNMEECFKALIDRLDWNNPKGDRCPFDLTKPLPLKGRPGHLTVVAEYFFNNDLEFLKSSDLEKKCTMSITKTKLARYKIVGIEDMNILGVKSASVKKLHGYGHLEEIMVKRAGRQLHKFKKGDFVDLHLNDIEDMLLLKSYHQKTVKNLQLSVESYQKKLNITEPQKTFPEIEFKEQYILSHKPPGVIYEDFNKQKRVMRADELYKFSDETLKTVRNELHRR
ncbi:hypothetical protein Tco_1523493 [Tanacetum coccineum]